MKKIAVVYWSGTGNTEQMAHAVMDGIAGAGGEGTLFEASDFSAEKAKLFEGIAFGCPAMGMEQLEMMTFEPMFSSCEADLKDKKLALFGSYDWGEGEWMRNFEERCIGAGARLAGESVITRGAPDEVSTEGCKELGRLLTVSE